MDLIFMDTPFKSNDSLYGFRPAGAPTDLLPFLKIFLPMANILSFLISKS